MLSGLDEKISVSVDIFSGSAYHLNNVTFTLMNMNRCN